jgi:CO/xanthine dehydrogenase FAD-binding subunit
MIPFDFEYYKPDSLVEALQTHQSLSEQGKKVIYFSGGTEFITLGRINQISANAVIDIKGISECNVLEMQGGQIVIGAAVPLNKMAELNVIPLLTKTIKDIADHTSRNKITLGGNLNSKLAYRECVLPLLVTEAKVKITGIEGEKTVRFDEVFDKELQLRHGELLTQILIDKSYAPLPFVWLKKTRRSNVDYPLVSIAALVKDNKLRTAFSGVCEFPFRSGIIEGILNDSTFSMDTRIDQAIGQLPAPIAQDAQGSSEYREFVLRNVLVDTMEALEWIK